MRISVDGQPFDVPDDATPEEIDSLTSPSAPTAHGPSRLTRAVGALRGAGQWALQGAEDAATGVAHGISSGTGTVSRLVKDALLRPGELEQNEADYQKAKQTSPHMAPVGNFAGEMYTPENAFAGQMAGYGIGAAAKGVSGWVGKRLAKIAEETAPRAAEIAEKPVLSLEAAARERATNAYRQAERYGRALDNPDLPAAEREALEAMRSEPRYVQLLEANSKSIQRDLPTAAAELDAAREIAREARAGLPAAIKAETERMMSNGEAASQVGARLGRYGPVAIGTAIGAHVGGPVGTAVGALAGAGTRPMNRALLRMAKHPSLRSALYRTLDAAAEGTAASSGSAGRSAMPAAGGVYDWLTEEQP